MKTKQKIDVITKDIKINEIIDKYPEITPILLGYGLHCVGCNFSHHDTIEIGAKVHGLTDEDVEMMIRDANALIEEIKKN
ncbi:DUF1858 domain-containing protein [Candidatus Gottesmanbacteria bacterium]|nr:DUF1858 domain-containing protein [Candidatus Gottesmanbacteria bacterium]